MSYFSRKAHAACLVCLVALLCGIATAAGSDIKVENRDVSSLSTGGGSGDPPPSVPVKKRRMGGGTAG